MQSSWLLSLLLLLPGCIRHNNADITPAPEFNQPVKVAMIGYNGNFMEPFLSRDGNILQFNNLNSPP